MGWIQKQNFRALALVLCHTLFSVPNCVSVPPSGWQRDGCLMLITRWMQSFQTLYSDVSMRRNGLFFYFHLTRERRPFSEGLSHTSPTPGSGVHHQSTIARQPSPYNVRFDAFGGVDHSSKSRFCHQK